jgi:lipopolysaccharide transport system permease protein
MLHKVNQKQSLGQLLNPWRTAVHLYSVRELLIQASKRNIEARYRGTALGIMWAIATPLFMLAVYTFVFSVVFKSRWGTDLPDSKVSFALIMMCGLALFNIFSECVNGSVGVIAGNPNYVKKVIFPLEILPAASVLSAFFIGLIWLALLLLAAGLLMHRICLTAVCLPLILIPFGLFCCGLCWMVSSLGIYIRDLSHAVGIIVQVLFFMTPVFYAVQMVPEHFRWILQINPMTIIIENARRVLIYSQWPNWKYLAVSALFAVVVYQLGYVWFMKTKTGFADVL